MEKVYLLLGTNSGSLKENLINTLDELTKIGVKILKKSQIYRTKPWGKTDQPYFLNMAIEVESPFPPEDLLVKLKEVEKRLGRKSTEHWGPRKIDIDILFYGHRKVNNLDLIIPHPYFFQRPFAIIPMADIAPDFIPPGQNKSIKELAVGVDNEGIETYCD